MQKLLLIATLLTFALGLSGCATNGPVLPSSPLQCPKPPPVDPALMQPSSYGTRTRAILFDSPTTPTPKSERSKQPSEPTTDSSATAIW